MASAPAAAAVPDDAFAIELLTRMVEIPSLSGQEQNVAAYVASRMAALGFQAEVDEAGNAVAYGMTWDDALRSITLAPAEAFGVADRVGSLQAGREANIVVWSGDPFEFASKAERVYIRGELQGGKSRADELAERYKTLPPKFGTPP